ncbi:hypothetical protein [Spongiactinospora sp. TRM90649]|uniref:hypothetical protein n=1 Tax=Spongiactinospora sp. TRM90649 TaxID=3031114 RepID=UPI0023F91E5A|nr:hypothetical protein [Spongiactinospora sp. TRM90649]MDF5754697.1 hypothetical protein [Spongiactinospora sp. TRM90649]
MNSETHPCAADHRPRARVSGSPSTLTSQGAGRFGAVLDEQWSVNARPHGGYLLAVLGRAAVEESGEGRRPPPDRLSTGAFTPAPPGHGGPSR